jgi:hypothetical protein
VDLVAEEHGKHLLGAACPNEDVHARKTLTEATENAGKDVSGNGQCGPEAKGAELDVADLLYSVTALLEGLEDALDIRTEGIACVGEADAAAATLEQLFSELALQGLDARGDGRLG